jgi:hypothetical protein
MLNKNYFVIFNLRIFAVLSCTICQPWNFLSDSNQCLIWDLRMLAKGMFSAGEISVKCMLCRRWGNPILDFSTVSLKNCCQDFWYFLTKEVHVYNIYRIRFEEHEQMTMYTSSRVICHRLELTQVLNNVLFYKMKSLTTRMYCNFNLKVLVSCILLIIIDIFCVNNWWEMVFTICGGGNFLLCQ